LDIKYSFIISTCESCELISETSFWVDINDKATYLLVLVTVTIKNL